MHEPLIVNTVRHPVPDWWRIAHMPLIVADEASTDLGYGPSSYVTVVGGSIKSRWANTQHALNMRRNTRTDRIRSVDDTGDDTHSSRHVALDSLCKVVDRTQVLAYGLQGVLNVDTLSSGSTLTAVICKDLARVDPGLSLIRQIGPSIVIALLMDGSQIVQRWPGIYAAALADDPGSSVLTLTCLGLVDRMARIRRSDGLPASDSVAFWRNCTRDLAAALSGDNFKEMELPPGGHTVKLLLKAEQARETTMDGRQNSDGVAWIYQDHHALSLAEAEMSANGWDWIAPRGP